MEKSRKPGIADGRPSENTDTVERLKNFHH